MIYIVKVYRDGELVRTEEVFGYDNAAKIEATYADIPGWEVLIHPDAFRYLRLHHNIHVS